MFSPQEEGNREREKDAVCRWTLTLFSVLSNPHVKLFPALHRKLPTKGPTVMASARASGNVGAVAWRGWERERGGRLSGGGGCKAAGQLWRVKAPTSTAHKHFPQAVQRELFVSIFYLGTP